MDGRRSSGSTTIPLLIWWSSDLEMPRMSGWEFLEAANRAARLAGTRIMMLTGRAEHLRILDWVSKPAPPDVLVARIRQHISTPL